MSLRPKSVMESFSKFEKSFAKKKKKLTSVRDVDCLRTANSCRFEGVNTKGGERENVRLQISNTKHDASFPNFSWFLIHRCSSNKYLVFA